MPRKRPSEAPDAVDVDLLASIRALGRLATADDAPDPRVAERLRQIVDIAGLRQAEELGEPETEPVGLEQRD